MEEVLRSGELILLQMTGDGKDELRRRLLRLQTRYTGLQVRVTQSKELCGMFWYMFPMEIRPCGRAALREDISSRTCRTSTSLR